MKPFDVICRYSENTIFKVGETYTIDLETISGYYTTEYEYIIKTRVLDAGDWPEQAPGASGYWFERIV